MCAAVVEATSVRRHVKGSKSRETDDKICVYISNRSTTTRAVQWTYWFVLIAGRIGVKMGQVKYGNE